MKTPLCYQRTEYDCGPTTLLNAINFQFEREEIPPELLKLVTIYTTDLYSDRGEHGKGGTSRLAMMFISGWLNEYGRATGFPIETEYLAGNAVRAERGSRISLALTEGAAIIVRVMHDRDEHYILLTGITGETVFAWDPYFDNNFTNYAGDDIAAIEDRPFSTNRHFPIARLNETGGDIYNMVGIEDREAIIFYNKNTRKPLAEPEYAI